MISIGIIEDIEDYRKLLQILLSSSPDMQVLFSCMSSEAAIEEFKKGKIPDVCIIDIQLPGKSGIDLLNWIQQQKLKTFSIICTAYDTDDKLFNALQAGAHGYLLKSTPPGAIIDAVKEVVAGGSPMSSDIARRVVLSFQQKKSATSFDLTSREKEILDHLSRGLLYKEIAAEVNISVETVRRHCFNIYEKLHVHNRTEALNKYFGNQSY